VVHVATSQEMADSDCGDHAGWVKAVCMEPQCGLNPHVLELHIE